MSIVTTLPTQNFSLGILALPTSVAPRRVTVHGIQEEVARFYGIPLREMTSQRRGQPIARYRQIAMFLSRELTEQSFPNMGRMFGGRDHTTIMHGCKVIEAQLFDDEILAQDIAYLKARLA